MHQTYQTHKPHTYSLQALSIENLKFLNEKILASTAYDFLFESFSQRYGSREKFCNFRSVKQ